MLEQSGSAGNSGIMGLSLDIYMNLLIKLTQPAKLSTITSQRTTLVCFGGGPADKNVMFMVSIFNGVVILKF